MKYRRQMWDYSNLEESWAEVLKFELPVQDKEDLEFFFRHRHQVKTWWYENSQRRDIYENVTFPGRVGRFLSQQSPRFKIDVVSGMGLVLLRSKCSEKDNVKKLAG